MIMEDTHKDILKILEDLNFKGYEKHFNKNSNGDYNHLQNFFIWKRKNRGHEYLRVCLMSKGWYEKKVYYWAVDFNFVPFNKKKCDKWKSKEFKGSQEDLYFKYFDEAVLKIKEFLKGGLK